MEEIRVKDNKLIIGNHFADDLIKQFGSPLYVYDEETIRNKIISFNDFITYRPFTVHYAMKANPNFSILKLVKDEGASIDAVSVNEIRLALKAGFEPSQIMFTGNNMTDDEMVFAKESGAIMNIDSLSRLEKFAMKYSGSKVCVRINPNAQASTHSHLITATDDKKFGISYRQIDEIKGISEKYGIKVTGIHGHLGTNIFNSEEFLYMMDIILDSAKQFPDLEFVDFGGGYGVGYRPGESNIDMKNFGTAASQRFEEFCNEYGRKLELKIEPGRYIVCESGYLLSKINTVKRRKLPYGKEKVFYGLDTNMAQLARPAMYDSYHHIVNASEMEGDSEVADIVGNICESGDFLGKERKITAAKEGDVIAILNAGAYGFSMSSNYNFFTRPAEVLVKGDNYKLITRREEFEDIIKNMVLE